MFRAIDSSLPTIHVSVSPLMWMRWISPTGEALKTSVEKPRIIERFLGPLGLLGTTGNRSRP